ncbi:MAG TPA: OmpA family protein, partial [Burkholderiales bacterium]|nr:OmpA family protein [Burkholderiales bacterium]
MRILTGLCAFLVAGCVAIPRANNAVESARATYRLAAANAEVQLRAPVELQIAERALAEAERFHGADADPAIVAHLSYVAEQRARIALKTAELRKAEAAVATSSEQRNRMLLDVRAREKMREETLREEARLARSVGQQTAEDRRAADERASQFRAELRRLQSDMSGFRARETERGWVLTLSNELLFDSGEAKLKSGAHKALESLAQFMRKEPEREVAIEGFTDATGASEVNRRLSAERADALKQALVARGVEPHRIDARGYGPAFPIASNETAVGRQLNRRVEVVIA